MRHALLVSVVLLGCNRTTPAPTPVASASVAVTAKSAAPVASAKPAAATTPAFLRIAKLPSGPVVIKNYPQNVANGMNEYAGHVGFNADSSIHAYCWETGGQGGTICELLARDGSTKSMRSDENVLMPNGGPDPKEVAKKKEIDTFIHDEKIPALSVSKVGPGGPDARGPALTGTWPYTDITLDVALIEAETPSPDKPPMHPAFVKIGGAVAGEKPVFPVSLLPPKPIPGALPHFARLNGFALSPDGSDFGLLANFFACEYCIDFAQRRMPIGELAAAIYNDTGFRHHQKKEWPAAAALFEKAVAADPSAKLAAYNLACAWARLNDPRTKDALAYAITLDSTVPARAQKDEDFASVHAEPWFPK